MEKNTYYITTPIYYASGKLTVGHCFSTVLADICARYNRLDGKKVLYVTGSDEHGLKIARVASEHGMTPKEWVDKTVDEFKYIWQKLGITYDKFIRTTDAHHEKLVKDVYQKLFDKGDIYLSKYKGLYCVPCETFFTEAQLVDGKCPDCGRDVEMTEEESYFLRLSKYQGFLEDYFDKHSDFLVPESRKNEIYNTFIKPGVTDLCVSRTTFDWGVKLPFNDKHVAYVWIDALLNYLSVLGYGTDDDSNFKEFWPCNVHFVGRDISRFHAIIWPILLKMLDLPLPKQIHSHGFITLKGDKISKSKSNGFNPLTLVDKYGADALRYYLAKEGPIFNDSPYTAEQFINTINSDLCNDLGNLVSRTLAMITQYNGGIVPSPKVKEDSEEMLASATSNLYNKVADAMSNQKINEAVGEIFSTIRLANKYIDMTEPWKLAKDTTKKDKLDTVLYYLSETIRVCTTLLQAFLFETPAKIFEKFGYSKELQTFDSIKSFGLENYGSVVNKGENLFPRLDVKAEIEFLDTPNAPQKEEKKETKMEEKKEEKSEDYIAFDDFLKVKLFTGKVLACEKVPNADKLLKSTVEMGNETRTIVSGIAKHYAPEDLVGKTVIVVSNLAPRKLRGIDSFGMLLCAEDKDSGKLSLLTTLSDVASGSEVG